MATTPASGSTTIPPGSPGPVAAAPGEPPAAATYLPERSTYLQYLPGLYQENDFLGRFLLIFESILSPTDRMAGSIHHYLHPDLAPPHLLRWLAAWLGIVLDERWPEERQRDLVRGATQLYRWRGTRRGLSTVLRLATGVSPEIIEPTAAEVASDASLAFRFRVRIPAGQALDRDLIQAIIDLEKPAWVACDLELASG